MDTVPEQTVRSFDRNDLTTICYKIIQVYRRREGVIAFAIRISTQFKIRRRKYRRKNKAGETEHGNV